MYLNGMKQDYQGQLKDGQIMSPMGECLTLTYQILHCQGADTAYTVNHCSFRAPIQGPLCNTHRRCTPTKSNFSHLKLNFTTGLMLFGLKHHSAEAMLHSFLHIHAAMMLLLPLLVLPQCSQKRKTG